MNTARIAHLLRELAEEFDIDEGESRVKIRPPVKARSFPPPLKAVSETDKMRAKQMLRRRGLSA